MSHVQEVAGAMRGQARTYGAGDWTEHGEAPLAEFRHRYSRTARSRESQGQSPNVGTAERVVSVAAGGILALLGLRRRDLTGLAITGVGGALLLRGSTGYCAVYRALGVDTSADTQFRGRREDADGVHVSVSYLINKSPETLYSFWRNFENLPQFMSHLESVRKIDERRSHWVAKAPRLYGGKVEWDAEVTADEPNARIAWRALPAGDVEHRGSITFTRALGDRGTKVRVELDYHPPAGEAGRLLAKLFGEEPQQQIHDDLRNFKRIMELGEIPTIIGQPHGTCRGHGRQYTE